VIGKIWRDIPLYSPTISEYNSKNKMATSRSLEIMDKEISEIKINSVLKNTKDLCKMTKTIIRLRLGDYREIFTSTSSRWIFPDSHLAFGKELLNILQSLNFSILIGRYLSLRKAIVYRKEDGCETY
jgi:mRNA-degrading endonuclease RelE of RelBE toxin-antitoxin system